LTKRLRSQSVYCYKEVDQATEKIANLGINRELGVVYFNSPSKNIINVLNADVVGVISPKNSRYQYLSLDVALLPPPQSKKKKI